MGDALCARLGAMSIAVVVVVGASGCSGGDDATSASTTAPGAVTSTSTERTQIGGAPSTDSPGVQRCLVRLHGKGGTGADTVTDGDVTIIAPTGNSDGWGAKQWLYFPDDEYEAARRIVADSVAGCDEVIINGFSNGASFAASLYCHGETFDGRLVGVVVDDPVTDHAVDGCTPDPSVSVTLYTTGALEATATPGWPCDGADWTCEGGETIGIDAYAEALGTNAHQSPFSDHEWYLDAPETRSWRT